MNTREFLQEVQKLIETPDQWTQGAPARDANGCPVDSASPQAVCFCMEGALVNVYFENQSAPGAFDLYRGALACLIWVVPEKYMDSNEPIAAYNDSLEMMHAAILTWIDQAMELAS